MKLHEIQAKRSNIAREMRALHDSIGDTTWTDEQRKKWEDAKIELSKLDDLIKREEELRAMDNLFVQATEPEQRNEGQQSEDERRAAVFDKFVRHGAGELTSEERSIMNQLRAQGVTGGAAATPGEKGGYTVPTQFRNLVIDAMKAYGGLASISQIINTANGQSIDWAFSDGTAEVGEMIGENTAATESDVSFSPVTIGAKKMSSKIIRCSNELLQDSGIDMNAYLANRIAQRIGRGEAAQIINGDGTGNNVKGLAAQVSKTVASKSKTAVDWTELLGLKHSIDPAYRNSGSFRFLFNDNTFVTLSALVDGNKRPLWLPEIAGVAPATIVGVPYVIDQGIADIGADAKFIYCGDFSRFILRRVTYMTLKRLVERYAEFDQVGFLAFHRFDCLLEDAGAVKALVAPH